MSQYLIKIIEPNGAQQVKVIGSQALTIGRDPDNNVVLSTLVASRHHAKIEWYENNLYITDLNSANGTYLGDMKLAPNNPTAWAVEQMVHIGQVMLQLEVSQQRIGQASTVPAESPQVEANALRQQIESHLEKVNLSKAYLQRNHKRISVINTLFNAASTFVAGLATLSGQAVVGQGDSGWQLTCGIAAALALGATIISGVQQNFGTAERLNKVSECAAKLRALQVETVASNMNIPDVRKQYQSILSQYPEIDW